VISSPALKRALRACGGRYAGSVALVALFGAAESAGCGSNSELLIGRNAPVAPEAGGGAEPADGASEAASDTGTGPDAELDATGAGGAPDNAACATSDVAPAGSLLHRYSFDGTGSVAKDSVGGADGQVEPGAALNGTGLVALDGLTGYVNLPNHLISVLTDVTFVTWTTFLGGAGFERIFDFGVGVAEDDTSGEGQSYVAVSPFGGANKLQMLTRDSASLTTPGEIQLTSAADIDDAKEHQVAVVFASVSHAELYLDGQLLGRIPIPFSLSDINDVNDWIGRSQWVDDHSYNGTVDEFRIYGQALTPCAIQALDAAGPDAP
jgi:hypothetical protein